MLGVEWAVGLQGATRKAGRQATEERRPLGQAGLVGTRTVAQVCETSSSCRALHMQQKD